MSVASFPSGIPGGAPPENAFWCILVTTNFVFAKFLCDMVNSIGIRRDMSHAYISLCFIFSLTARKFMFYRFISTYELFLPVLLLMKLQKHTSKLGARQ